MTLLEIMIVLAILALVMGLVVGPRLMTIWGDAREDLAKLAVTKLSVEAYPQWLTRNGGKVCPDELADLADLTNKKDTKDPWGNDYVMRCPPNLPAGAKGIAIVSFGADGKEGTDDDVKSW